MRCMFYADDFNLLNESVNILRKTSGVLFLASENGGVETHSEMQHN
jgi:hypothetical protein